MMNNEPEMYCNKKIDILNSYSESSEDSIYDFLNRNGYNVEYYCGATNVYLNINETTFMISFQEGDKVYTYRKKRGLKEVLDYSENEKALRVFFRYLKRYEKWKEKQC